jgi:WD40-like Beta Propeller Repeat
MRGIVAAALGTVLLTSTGASASTPSSRIVFKRLVGQQFELFKAKPDGSGLTRLRRNGHFDEEPDWSPDGRRLLALADSLVLRSPDGRLLRRLPPVGFDPSWSPNGRLIAYLVGRCPTPKQLCPGRLKQLCPGRRGRRRAAGSHTSAPPRRSTANRGGPSSLRTRTGETRAASLSRPTIRTLSGRPTRHICSGAPSSTA